ncbi:MAG: ATP-binding protein [Rhodobacteraceae bacterium]|nr:ATP-binding protein [Paracoccaceae bacterium]
MTENDKLYLRFHGRIIDSLGIQMYQSPVAAIAELIANAWDADATVADVHLPDTLAGEPKITVHDDGHGMTFGQCQNRYLNIGRDRRLDEGTDRSPDSRPVLGRKGIGKFAGFGIADHLKIDTTSKETGERTVFSLDLNDLRGTGYIDTEAKEIPALRRDAGDRVPPNGHGTTVTLTNLKIRRRPNTDQFLQSMARRFLINQSADNFEVRINGEVLAHEHAPADIEFDFPSVYRGEEQPDGLRIEDDVGIEEIDGGEIRWRFRFSKDPIGTEEFRGVSVFCGIKVAQTPFFFDLAGGVDGQHGQRYLTGQVQADYLDRLDADVITTERQRINWEHEDAQPLLDWGQNRVKSLLSIWKARRAEEKHRWIDDRMTPFSSRLERLKTTERRTVTGAIKKIATIESISEDQLEEMANSLLTAWEQGRLRELINDVADVESMDESVLLGLLAETQVLNALHIAEAVRAKTDIVSGLRKRIEDHDLENAVRDYMAENPWLLSPEWETFTKETSVKNLAKKAAKELGLTVVTLSGGNALI